MSYGERLERSPEFFPFFDVEEVEIDPSQVSDYVTTGEEVRVLVKVRRGTDVKIIDWLTNDCGFAAIRNVLLRLPQYKGWRFDSAIDAPLPF